MRYQHDAVPCCDTEQGDESNQRRERKYSAGQVHSGDSADQGQGQIEHDDKRVFVRTKRNAEDQEDPCDYANSEQHQSLVSTFRALELASIFDPVALRQLYCFGNTLLNLLNCAVEVSPRYIALNHDSPLDAFAHNEVRTPVFLD